MIPKAEELLERLYLEEGLSSPEIAKRLGYTSATIRHWLRFYDISIRTLAEARVLAIKRGVLQPLCGSRNPNWKGDIHRGGRYVMQIAKDHPRADMHGYVQQHILVWEKANSKALPRDWLIHHLNGIRDDNRPENLMAMPNKLHSTVLFVNGLKLRIRQLENKICHLKAERRLVATELEPVVAETGRRSTDR